MRSSTSKEENIKKAIEILKLHHIELEVWGCGCCDSPEVRFSYRGEEILNHLNCSFSTKKKDE